MKGCLLTASLFVYTACSNFTDVSTTSIDFSPNSSVKREEVIAIAEAFRTHLWYPTDNNVFHGEDPDGVQVDTPDVAYKGAIRPGWWQPNQENMGIPYKWGGFDSLAEFDSKLAKGHYAGDLYTDAKRSALYDAVSPYACGIDCSGFVSKCWRLDRSYSTRNLPDICDRLKDYGDLRPGDILNKKNTHVLIFVHFIDPERKYFMAYETGSPPSWKVLKHRIEVEYVKGLGFLPYRYKNIR